MIDDNTAERLFTHCGTCRSHVHRGMAVWRGHSAGCKRFGLAPDARAADALHPQGRTKHKERK